MKRFIYTFHGEKRPKGNVNYPYTVRIYQIKRNSVELVAKKTETCMGEFQLVMLALEQFKLLPKKAFVRNASHGYPYDSAPELKAAGFADVTGV